MKIFVLEDDPDRIRRFCGWFGLGLNKEDKIQWDCVHTCVRDGDFRGPYDYIFLDHDLGGRQMVENEDCGTEFVKLIRSRIGTARVIIHSFNPDASKRMLQDIKEVTKNVVYFPFGGSEFLMTVKAIQEMCK